MSVFEYGSSIASIILGLAVAHLLGGLTAPLRLESISGRYWLFSAWCVSTLLVVVGAWFGIWSVLRDVHTLHFSYFTTVIVMCCVLYSAARVLVPDFSNEPLPDLRKHFESVRTAFFCCLAFVFGGGTAAQVGGAELTPSGSSAPLEISSGILLCILALAGAFVPNSRFQAALAVGWPIIYLVQQSVQPAISSG